jgi:lysophospholipase L1-like esterase
MSLSVAILASQVTDEYGRALAVGSTVSLPDDYARSLVSQSRARFASAQAGTQATQPTSNRFMSGVVDLAALGADKNASSLQIRNAFAAGIARGGHLLLSDPGTYVLTDQISIANNNVTIELGAGVTLDASSMAVPCFTASARSNIALIGDGRIVCTAAGAPTFTTVDNLQYSVRVESSAGVALTSGPWKEETNIYGESTAFLGDSIIGTSYTEPSGVNLARENINGFAFWVKAFLQGRLSATINAGVSGALSSAVVNQVPACINAGVSVAFEMCGINDISQDIPVATVLQNKKIIWRKLSEAGVRVFALPVLPINSALAAYTTARYQNILRLNDLIKNACAQDGTATFVPIFQNVVDPASATGNARSGYLHDNLHPSVIGSIEIGRAIAQSSVVSSAFAQYDLKSSLMQEWASGTNYPTFIANGLMSGAGGTIGTGVTGTVPTNWDVSRLTGTPTAACTVDARSDGFGNDVTVVVTAGANNDQIQIRTDSIQTQVSINDLAYAECEVTYSAATNLRSLFAYMIVQVDGVNYFVYCGLDGVTGHFSGMPASGGPFVFKTLPVRFNNPTLNGAAITALRLFVVSTFSAAGGATIKVGRARGVKVVSS